MITPDRPFVAYVDESGADQSRDPGTYLLAAVVMDPEHLTTARDAMRDLRRGHGKLHWHDERAARHIEIMTAISALDIEHVIAVRHDTALRDRPERRRRACLKSLAQHLEQLGVGSMTLESRGPHDDQRDRTAIDVFRASKLVSSELRLEHQVGPAEPLLWIPDAVCGAVAANRLGRHEPWDILAHKCTVISAD